MEAAMNKFTVDYSYNCDGGVQEFSTAKGAILAIFPEAQVKGQRNHNYPIRVTIKDGREKVIWSSDQRSLFRKYPMVRSKSVDEIKEALRKVKRGMLQGQRTYAAQR